MQQLAGALGYGNGHAGISGNGSMSSRTQPTVLVSQPSMELTDRMYSDLVDSLRHSRDAAERRAQMAESRLHELHSRIAGIPGMHPVPPPVFTDE